MGLTVNFLLLWVNNDYDLPGDFFDEEICSFVAYELMHSGHFYFDLLFILKI